MKPNSLSANLYQAISRANKPREIKSWHASSAAQCPRAQYLARKGILPVTRPSAAKMLRWQAGHTFEGEIRPFLLGLYPNLISNERIYNRDLDLTGEYDNFDPDSGYLIEIKTIGPRAVRYKKVGEDRFNLKDDQPYLAHEWQQHAYVHLLAGEGIEVKGIAYLYISLEGLLVPYVTEVKPDLLKAVKERVDLLNVFWTRQTPPPCMCNKEQALWGSVLQFCDYRDKENGCCSINLLKEKEII